VIIYQEIDYRASTELSKMALIRTEGHIVDISGKLGGNMFKRDKSGLHCQVSSSPRVAKNSEAQRQQRAWYSGQKLQERITPDMPRLPTPPARSMTGIIYRIGGIDCIKSTHLSPPVQTSYPEAGYYEQEIDDFLFNFYKNHKSYWSLTAPAAYIMMRRWLYKFHYVYGFNWDACLEGAKVSFENVENNVIRTLNILPWASLIAWGSWEIYSYVDSDNHPISGSIMPDNDVVLMLRKDGMHWGRLVSRPSEDMYGFADCGLTGWNGALLNKEGTSISYESAGLYTGGDMEMWYSRWGLWNCYNIKDVEVYFTGYSYEVVKGFVRIKLGEYDKRFFNVPVGYVLPGGTPADFLDDLPNHYHQD